jgi:hypothetical protein
MRSMKISMLAATVILAIAGSRVEASTLLGTEVTGALYFTGYPQNFFDPVNGRVPTGCLNTAGTAVVISSNAVEFGYADGTATITADLTDTQLTVTDGTHTTAGYNPMRIVLTNAAFTALSKVSDGFPNGGLSASLSAGAITLDWAGGSLTNGADAQAVFTVSAPPLPRLSIQLTSTNATVISWPAPSTGFGLQQNDTLNPATWSAVTNTVVLINGNKQVIVSQTSGAQFYRLSFP